MPEGDTIHRLARAIRPDLVERRLERVRLRDQGDLSTLEGKLVEAVEAQGKHLLISVEGGWTLRTHLGMYGDVHRYRNGQRWKRSRLDAVLELSTDGGVVLAWFEPARAELLPTKLIRAHRQLGRLGPDLLGDSVDFEEVLRRAKRCAEIRGPTYTIGELLLDQSIACGIGNIYKNELLFLAGLDPWTPALAVGDDQLEGLYRNARELLERNLKRGKRSTRAGSRRGGAFAPGEPRLWVYGREGRQCLRCGATILLGHQGVQPRVTFSCPRCQPELKDRPATASAPVGARGYGGLRRTSPQEPRPKTATGRSTPR